MPTNIPSPHRFALVYPAFILSVLLVSIGWMLSQAG